MKKGYLSDYFKGVAIKRLSHVEVDISKSNQHEFNGVTALKSLFGLSRRTFPSKFIYLTDSDELPIAEDGMMTWYDARESHPTRSEHRLYFPTNTSMNLANAGDFLVIGLLPDEQILVLIVEAETTIASQVLWLFGQVDSELPKFSVRENLETEQDRLSFASHFILENINISVDISEENYLDEMLQRFDGKFPPTKVFSEYTRATLPNLFDSKADTIIMRCMEQEEILFKTLEKHFVGERLKQGFTDDVEGFLSFSLSVQNRRKSRVGYALENHLEAIFKHFNIDHTHEGKTENKSKPDFIFPSIEAYHNYDFPLSKLSMLGVKSTCKDRWRQVLSEADRIQSKHLFTLEMAISKNQTDEMQRRNLQLVLPQSLHETYSDSQRSWLMNFDKFVELVLERQT